MDSAIPRLFSELRTYECQKGQILVNASEEPKGVYFIKEGYVKTYDITVQGDTQLVALSGPGEIFPLYWALDKEYRKLFYQAMTNVKFSVLDKESFKRDYENNDAILREIIKLLLRSYKFSQQRIQNLEYKTPLERIAYRLLLLGEYFGHQEKQHTYIDIPVTHQDMADSLNMTRDTANRVTLSLIKRGILEKTGQKIIIKKADGLRTIFAENTSLDS